MSSPKSRSRSSLRRDGSTRTPLQERSRSQANISSRIVRDARLDPTLNSANPSPYPTKPEHILRPSAVRRQRRNIDGENTTFTTFSLAKMESGSSSSYGGYLSDDSDRPRTANAPALSLKRSVAALRDIYEAQAEKSRPYTAVTSPAMQPTSAASNRLRRVSSSNSTSGAGIWDALQCPSIDDLALLPAPLRVTSGTVRSVTSELENRRLQELQSSSPNITRLGSSSTSRFPIYDDSSNPEYRHMPPSSSTGTFNPYGPSSSLETSSSPNLVRLGRSSSVSEMLEEDESSSPNVIRLGTSLPDGNGSSTGKSTGVDSSPGTVRHHERQQSDPQEMLSFAARSGISNPFNSSPLYETFAASTSTISPDNGLLLPSSPPNVRAEDPSWAVSASASDVDAERPQSAASNSSGIVQTHKDLQAAMTSSPAPPMQYPVVRVPAATSWAGLSVPKRPPRVAAADPVKWRSRLSTVPSEMSGCRSNRNSMRAAASDDDYSLSDAESDIASARAYLASHEAINTRSPVVSSREFEQNKFEAADNVSDLPPTRSRLPPPSAKGYLGLDSSSSSSRLNSLRNSMDTRLNSMKSFRNNSMRNSQRPSSSSSENTFQIPSWARRYYSGIYRDSFQEMYPSATDLHAQNHSSMHGPAQRQAQLRTRPSTSNLTTAIRPTTSISRKASSIAASAKSIRFPRRRPPLNARHSHLEPGVGPLVSNPVRPPTTSLRPTSIPLDPADPRAHWASTEAELVAHQNMMQNWLPRNNRVGAPTSWSRSPHLYREGGRTVGQSRWRPPTFDESHEPHISWRNAQVICFALGFITIIPWFVASFLPLPRRPRSSDLEKRMSSDVEGCRRRNAAVVEELRWENAAWWMNLNRCMCLVGMVVIVLIVVLSVVGTRNW